jgi:hypothetical protein
MTLTYPRLLVVAALAAVLEFAAFEWRYRDLIFLAGPAPVVAAAPASTFARYFNTALARPRATRTTLEHLVLVATARRDQSATIATLYRLVQTDPRDPHLRLRLADALRQSGRLEEARVHYREVIAHPEEAK